MDLGVLRQNPRTAAQLCDHVRREQFPLSEFPISPLDIDLEVPNYKSIERLRGCAEADLPSFDSMLFHLHPGRATVSLQRLLHGSGWNENLLMNIQWRSK